MKTPVRSRGTASGSASGAHTREAWLAATEGELVKVAGRGTRGHLHDRAAIGLRVGRSINTYRVATHSTLTIDEGHLRYARTPPGMAPEAALDGTSVIRTNLPASRVDDAETVRTYKALSQVERALRGLKTMDLHVRPIHHRTSDRVRSHIFLCMLAYYVEWHMRQAWRPLLFADEDQAAKTTRDLVARATRSAAADQKAATHRTTDGAPVHSFQTLLQDLSTIVRNRCRTRDAPTRRRVIWRPRRPRPSGVR